MTASNNFTDDRPSSDTTFVNGYDNQVSNYKTIQIVTGSATRKLSTEQKQKTLHQNIQKKSFNIQMLKAVVSLS